VLAINPDQEVSNTRHELLRALLEGPLARASVLDGGRVGKAAVDALGISREEGADLAHPVAHSDSVVK
jgi:hypothetical protein